MYVDEDRAEVTPVGFCRMAKQKEWVEVRIRRLFLPPSPPVHYARVAWRDTGEVVDYLMYDAARCVWKVVVDDGTLEELFA